MGGAEEPESQLWLQWGKSGDVGSLRAAGQGSRILDVLGAMARAGSVPSAGRSHVLDTARNWHSQQSMLEQQDVWGGNLSDSGRGLPKSGYIGRVWGST